MPRPRVQQGLDLLRVLQHRELTLAEIVDRLELITSSPPVIREIIEQAEAEGIIERVNTTDVKLHHGTHLSFENDVVLKSGEFQCRRCGADLDDGYFLNLDSGEFGAFGSSCIRKVTGKE